MVAVLGTNSRWAGIRAGGQLPVFEDADRLLHLRPLWHGSTSTSTHDLGYVKARAFAQLADFKNGKVIISPRIRQLYAHIGER